jgi:UDPglucose--hexose-1-phosphate uridylyltransferase
MEIRKDPITRSWVLIGDGESAEVAETPCRYCPGSDAALPPPILSLPVEGQHGQIRVFPHPAPLYRIEGEADRRADGFYDKMRPVGAHEVVIETPEHSSGLPARPETAIAGLLESWALRIADLKQDRRFKYITVFRNRGELSGQQIRHPHSELTATAFIPRRILYELRASQEYFTRKERCVICDVVRQEEQDGARVVDVSRQYLAVCPFASRVPYELWILPRYHHSSFENDLLRHRRHLELAGILRRSLTRLEQITNNYHLVLHTSPNTNVRSELTGYWSTIEDDYHWHIEILPITERRSKSYSIKEVYFSALSPEDGAARLKDLSTAPPPPPQSQFDFPTLGSASRSAQEMGNISRNPGRSSPGAQ